MSTALSCSSAWFDICLKMSVIFKDLILHLLTHLPSCLLLGQDPSLEHQMLHHFDQSGWRPCWGGWSQWCKGWAELLPRPLEPGLFGSSPPLPPWCTSVFTHFQLYSTVDIATIVCPLFGHQTCTEQSNDQCHQLAAMGAGMLSTQSPGGWIGYTMSTLIRSWWLTADAPQNTNCTSDLDEPIIHLLCPLGRVPRASTGAEARDVQEEHRVHLHLHKSSNPSDFQFLLKLHDTNFHLVFFQFRGDVLTITFNADIPDNQ